MRQSAIGSELRPSAGSDDESPRGDDASSEVKLKGTGAVHGRHLGVVAAIYTGAARCVPESGIEVVSRDAESWRRDRRIDHPSAEPEAGASDYRRCGEE